MDPDHVACYAQAQVELRELFHELECNGQVSAAELQRSLAPFTAGDVKRDLLGLVAELKTKRQSLDEAEFLRVMWRRMYLTSAIDATKSGAARERKRINVSLAHVIVSVKRRQQLRQFASYYASRGISGAGHLTAPSKGMASVKVNSTVPTESLVASLGQKDPLSSTQPATQSELQADGSLLESIVALRRRHSSCYDVVTCVFDAELLQMRTDTLLTRTRSAEVRNCSRLYCLLYTKEAGNFVLGSTYFGENSRRNHQVEKGEFGITTETEDELSGSDLYRTFRWSDKNDQGLLMIRMEEVGLRNIVAVASSKASFAASTGRKLHQWRAPEPFRILTDNTEYLETLSSGVEEAQSDDVDNYKVETATAIRMLDRDPTGDCFGLLGGRPLLARAKTIADVGDLRQIAAGEHFFMAISSSGGLYSWDSCPNTSSSTAPPLGRGYSTPERVPWFPSSEKVFRVACGLHHTLVLTGSGLYAWGSNIYGQLGLGAHCSPADPHVLEPAPVCLPVDVTPVLDIACGDSHSVALCITGLIFTFGSNREGQLGIDESQAHTSAKIAVVADTGCAYEPLQVLLPQESEIDRRVYLITAGSQSTAVVATTGQVFQWGKCVPNGIDGARGRISRWLPEDLRAISEYGGALGPVWHSIAIADGLVVATRHVTVNSAATKDPAAQQ
ncbi:hypothetical protein V7S43_005878 [Phytophthora oleae]|uniref:Uncharacterized protein n=1 Tax=Phytophthora oleae TaxID=2107226 RepID=A0ABD3FSS5_9STRA